MTRRFYAKVEVPLSAGRVELTVDVTDLNALDAAARDAMFGLLRRCVDFAEDRDQEVQEVADVDQDRAEPAVPLVEMVPCGDCDRRFTPQGLAVHRARAHPRRAPSAPEPKPGPAEAKPERAVPTPRVCGEVGCDTLLSAYNKQEWCSIHEGNHLSPHLGRTG